MKKQSHINQLVSCKNCPLTYCLECQPNGCKCGGTEFLYDHGSIKGEGHIDKINRRWVLGMDLAIGSDSSIDTRGAIDRIIDDHTNTARGIRPNPLEDLEETETEEQRGIRHFMEENQRIRTMESLNQIMVPPILNDGTITPSGSSVEIQRDREDRTQTLSMEALRAFPSNSSGISLSDTTYTASGPIPTVGRMGNARLRARRAGLTNRR